MRRNTDPPQGVGGFFPRILIALLLVNLTTMGTLVYISYSYSAQSLAKHAKHNLAQQLEVLAERFDETYVRSLDRSLTSLTEASEMDDYLLGSEAERLVLKRRIERRFLQIQKDFPYFTEIRFIDDLGNTAIAVKDGRRESPQSPVDAIDTPEQRVVGRLYRRLRETPLLLSSGNMEWFMPPREMQVSPTFVDEAGALSWYGGFAKLDKDIGQFGGAVVIRVRLDDWIEELLSLRFFGVNPVWVIAADGAVLLAPDQPDAYLDPRPLLQGTEGSTSGLVETSRGLVIDRLLTLTSGEPWARLSISVPSTRLLQDLKPVLEFFSLVMLISAGLLAFISLGISRYLSKPVTELAVARNQLANAHRIARLGHWEWNIDSDNLVFSEHVLSILRLNIPAGGLPFGSFLDMVHPEDRESLKHAIERAKRCDTNSSIDYRVLRPDGSEQHLHQEIDIIAAAETRLVGTIQDISERKQAEAEIQQLAYFDTVTSLANRRLLDEMAERALRLAEETDHQVALLFLDLDHFKRVNDTLGHDAGDELLRQVSVRLLQCVRTAGGVGGADGLEGAGQSVARLGGDEFILLLGGLSSTRDAARVAERVCAALMIPFDIGGREVSATGSLGVSLFPNHGRTVDELLRRADAAMYHAKSKGRNRFEIYTEEIELAVVQRVSLETRLRRAIEQQEFFLEYQPRIELISHEMIGVEVLLRWMDRDEGVIAPGDFIPLAEETGLIVPIGEWVMREACLQLARWHAEFVSGPLMSINLSPAQFLAPDLIGGIRRAIEGIDIDLRMLEFELTESTLFQDVDAGVRLAGDLKDMGFALSIDDFGTGYSSLQLLRQFPVDALKIDQSFIRDLLVDGDDALIVRTTIQLGQSLGLKVVAEGVEQQGQYEFLCDLGCDQAQGFLLGRPTSEEQISEMLEATADRNSFTKRQTAEAPAGAG